MIAQEDLLMTYVPGEGFDGEEEDGDREDRVVILMDFELCHYMAVKCMLSTDRKVIRAIIMRT